MSESSATTWVEVSAGSLARNYRTVCDTAGVPVCAVVKANAYGHGLMETARIFEGAGARWLAVTRVEEARALRASGIGSKILVLTPPPSEGLVAEALALSCSITLSNAADLPRFVAAGQSAGKPLAVHLKIDTGMGRLGVLPSTAVDVARAIASNEHLVLEGVFTHFADASGPTARIQLARFNEARRQLGKHASRALVHASNSAALLSLPEARFDMVRIGTLLYGQDPPGAEAPFPLEATFTWKARLVAIQELAPGSTIGYGSEYTATGAERVGTLAIGWADGFTAEPAARSPSFANALTTTARTLAIAAGAKPGSRRVFFDDIEAKVLGRVGMQTVTVSLKDVPGATIGTIARIPCRRLLVSPLIDRHYVP
ncbi:MAG: alanine racemase [Actinomycetota bacterium]